ncbi:histidine kinase [Gloeothece citriformis PCC 7424]|uniref:histidine kinase n=1 Tax=Gloeothece citriformis (strain PCC 7424) TaxID=65393 RepID=B7KFP5_GLOC7|nr:HAMP domain-containing sensor histidine kinase [Gloeothece citriformis]ACK73370.1 histidine kinase [Gloeothece citriformis PCC 7424]
MFQGLRFRLLVSYLSVMAAILSFFSLWVYFRFNHRLYQQSEQLDRKLESIAQLAAPYFSRVEDLGHHYLKSNQKLPWEELVNSEQQSIEWFDEQGQIIASQGGFKLSFSPQVGFLTLRRKPFPIRTYTYPIFSEDSTTQDAFLEGYIRISQATEDITTVQQELLWQLTTGILINLVLIGIGGFWLTHEATAPIEESYQQLKQFTADASHELRNPLTAIQTSIEVMLNHPERVHPKDMKKLVAVASATEQMSRLTQDLLFLARTKTPVSTVENAWKPTSVNEILQNLVDLLEPLAEDKEITLKYQVLANVAVMGEPAQLSRLFSNLLQNAIQYSLPQGKVSVCLAKQNRFCLVSVEDTGIGIAPEDIPFVFNRFWRADKARSRREGGTGLGLSIAMAIAQHHGGKITVTSELGVGSCFKVYLPIYYGI